MHRSNHVGVLAIYSVAVLLTLSLTSRELRAGDCGTIVTPGLYVAETWTKAGSPYCVIGDIQVSLLTIEPGVQVLVDPTFEIEVLSTITAVGSPGDPILFAASDPAQGWGGLIFQKTIDASAFDYCTFQHATNSAIRLIDAVPPTFTQCRFLDNKNSASGGAIFARGVQDDLILLDCVIARNIAGQHGGGLDIGMASGFTCRLHSCLLAENLSNPNYTTGNFVGGGMRIVAGNIEILNTVFRSNRTNARCSNTFGCNVTSRGGALYVTGGGLITVENSEFLDNQCDARNNGNCFFGGSSNSYGSAVYINNATGNISNSTFACNKATATNCGRSLAGAGVYCANGSINIVNCTIARNDDNSGIHQAGGSIAVLNSIVYWNNADGTQIGGPVGATYCDIQNGYGAVEDKNFNGNPVFAGIGGRRDHLMIVLGSPCIDKGDPTSPDDVCFPPSLGEPLSDVGAYGGPLACNWQPDVWRPQDLDYSGTVNVIDLLMLLASWGPCPVADVCPNDTDCDGEINVVDLLSLLAEWG